MYRLTVQLFRGHYTSYFADSIYLRLMRTATHQTISKLTKFTPGLLIVKWRWIS
jgi:hypothetical protein